MVESTSAADDYREVAGRFTELVEAVPDDATWQRRPGSRVEAASARSTGSPTSWPVVRGSPSRRAPEWTTTRPRPGAR